MLTKTLLALPLLGLLVASASAQSFYIDFTTLPSPTSPDSGQFAGIPGTWNTVASNASGFGLVTTTGNPDNTDITLNGYSAGSNAAGVSFPVDLDPLYRDYVATVGGGFRDITLDDMDMGSYVAVLYSFVPNRSTQFQIETSTNIFGPDAVICPWSFPGTHSITETLVTIPFTVDFQNDTVTIRARGENFPGIVNGMQIIPTFGTAGCQIQPPNSLGAAPDIAGTGSNVAATNDLTLQVGLLPGALPNATPASPGAIVCFVSNFENASVPALCPVNSNVSTGTRCIGNNNLARVPVFDPVTGAASPGAVGFTTSFGTYALDVDLPSLAAQGISVGAGDTIYFQMVYRDLPDATCASSLVRWTNSVSITLQ
jgi:hypothetical protein